MDLLKEIIAQKHLRVSAAKQIVSPAEVRAKALAARDGAPRSVLSTRLSDDSKVSIIAEFKRRSPSRGQIATNGDPVSIAKAYESDGAAAVSVLTEEDYFGGSLDDLHAVRAAISLPILRKDFIFDDYQVYESAVAGADALLLIVAALDDEALQGLRAITEDELGLDALVEVHTDEEMRRAGLCGAKLIGVNNRDLRTFQVSLETSIRLATHAPEGAILISESGIASQDDIRRLGDAGYKGFLIGETLMRAGDPGLVLRSLTRVSEDTGDVELWSE
jgi:indole-3-glycerol phosphate synthase